MPTRNDSRDARMTVERRPPSDPFDLQYGRDLQTRVLDPILDHYFRPRIIGREKIPASGPVVLAVNHSGTAFPFDAIVLDFALWRADGMTAESKFRSLYEKELSAVWWMRPFGLDDMWRRGAAVDMTFDNFERLMLRGDRLIYYPEGVPGIGKGFARRYKLQHFHASFLLLAARHDVPIVPLSVVNAEWVMPFHFTLRPLDYVMQRMFRVPFLPLPAGILACMLPWMWYLSLPAHMTFVVGDAIDAREVLRNEGITDYVCPDRERLERAANAVRKRMQAMLDRNVAVYGHHPYDWRSLRAALRSAGPRLARALPTGWPISFIRNHRDHYRGPARSKWHAFIRDFDLVAFYIPFGWPLLSLARMLRRPPYGYRGLTRAEKIERQGCFVWQLKDHPLPPRTVTSVVPVDGARGDKALVSL